MDTLENNKDLYKIFFYFSIFMIFLGWAGFLLAMAGFFYKSIFIIILISGFFAIGYFKLKLFGKKIKLIVGSDFFIAGMIITIAVILFSLFTTPTIFSGRDQGAISEAAIRLSQNHKLEFSTPGSEEFFKIYGPGKALNFPGFHYTEEGNLKTQFPLPYISWLSIFYSIFGLTGMIIANAVLFYVFLMSFYLLARLFLDKIYSLLLLALTLSTFTFSWFLKFTLSENIALALLWISILSLVSFIKKQEHLYYLMYVISVLLLVFARIEGILFLGIGIAILLINKDTLKYIKKNLPKYILASGIALVAVAIWSFSTSSPFYKEIAKAVISNFTPSEGSSVATQYFGDTIDTLKTFVTYGMLLPLITGIIGILYFIKKKKWQVLAPFFIVSPTFIYLLNSQISSDHPWMLRRFAFSVVPVVILFSVLFISEIFKKKRAISYYAIFLLVLVSFYPTLKFITFSENRGLLEETERLSEYLENDSLVLVDQKATLDGWSMISGPLSFLYGKNAIYFFNPADLEKINIEKFNKIYIITSESNQEFYKENLPQKKFTQVSGANPVKVSRFTNTKDDDNFIPSLPKKGQVDVRIAIYEIK